MIVIPADLESHSVERWGGWSNTVHFTARVICDGDDLVQAARNFFHKPSHRVLISEVRRQNNGRLWVRHGVLHRLSRS